MVNDCILKFVNNWKIKISGNNCHVLSHCATSSLCGLIFCRTFPLVSWLLWRIVDMIRYWSSWMTFLSERTIPCFFPPQTQVPGIWAGFLATSLCGTNLCPYHFVNTSLTFWLPWHRSLTCPNFVKGSMYWETMKGKTLELDWTQTMAEIQGAKSVHGNVVLMYKKESGLGSCPGHFSSRIDSHILASSPGSFTSQGWPSLNEKHLSFKCFVVHYL